MMNALVMLAALSLAQAGPDDARLAKGEILTKLRTVAGSDMKEATAKAVIDAPPELVWAIVSDCKNYKNTMPSIVDSGVLKTEKPLASDGPLAVEVRHCRVVADLPFPFSDLVSVTRSVHTIDPGKRWRRQWTMIEGNYHRNDGDWTIEPWGTEGTKSLATYRIHAEPKVPLPGGMLTSIQEGKLPEVMTRMRANAAKRQASALAPLPAPTAPAPTAPATPAPAP